MKKLVLIALLSSLTVGCATNGDIENLQSQIDGLKTSVAQVSSDAASAQSSAAEAKAAAERTAKISKEVSDKLDRLIYRKWIK